MSAIEVSNKFMNLTFRIKAQIKLGFKSMKIAVLNKINKPKWIIVNYVNFVEDLFN